MASDSIKMEARADANRRIQQQLQLQLTIARMNDACGIFSNLGAQFAAIGTNGTQPEELAKLGQFVANE